jgi:hypothetical protein
MTLVDGQAVFGTVAILGSANDTVSSSRDLLVSLEPAVRVGSELPRVVPVRVRADGSFVLTGVAPGDYRFTVTNTSTAGYSWFVESAVVATKETFDAAIQVRPGEDVDGVVLTLSHHSAQISGTLQAASGRLVGSQFVVAIPSTSSLWRLGSRRMPTPVRPSTEGNFLLTNLPAGEYILATVSGIDPHNWFDIVLLERLAASSSVRVRLDQGENKTLLLTVR